MASMRSGSESGPASSSVAPPDGDAGDALRAILVGLAEADAGVEGAIGVSAGFDEEGLLEGLGGLCQRPLDPFSPQAA